MLVHRIIEAFEASNLKSYKELSKKSGVGYPTVCRVFREKAGRADTLKKLADTLDIPGDESTHEEFINGFVRAERVGNQYEIVVGEYTAKIGIFSPEKKFLTRATITISDSGWKKRALEAVEKFNSEIGR